MPSWHHRAHAAAQRRTDRRATCESTSVVASASRAVHPSPTGPVCMNEGSASAVGQAAVAAAGRLIDHLYRSSLDVRGRRQGTATALGVPEPSRPSLPPRHSERRATGRRPGAGRASASSSAARSFSTAISHAAGSKDGSFGVATRSSFLVFSRRNVVNCDMIYELQICHLTRSRSSDVMPSPPRLGQKQRWLIWGVPLDVSGTMRGSAPCAVTVVSPSSLSSSEQVPQLFEAAALAALTSPARP
jgi:hypothetical protein